MHSEYGYIRLPAGFGRDLLLEALADDASPSEKSPSEREPTLAVDLAVLRNFLAAAAAADVAFYSGEELRSLERVSIAFSSESASSFVEFFLTRRE